MSSAAKGRSQGATIGIIGAGPGGICMGDQAPRSRLRQLHDLRAGAGRRRHVVPQHVSRMRVRRAVGPLLVLVRAQARLVTPVRHAARDPRVLRALRRQVRPRSDTSASAIGIAASRWDDERAVWRLTTEHGDEHEFDVVIGAVGMFGNPAWPDIPGLDEFAGTVFHSARWEHEHDLTGERVAVIGSAASAVQFVPEIAPTGRAVGRLPADAQLGAAQGRRAVHARAARAVAHRPGSAPRSTTPGLGASRGLDHVLRPERDPLRAGVGLAEHGDRRGPRSARQAHARLPARVQAPAGLERVVSHVQPSERRAGHGGHRAHRRQTASSPADGKHRAGRHDRARDGIRDHPVSRDDRGDRADTGVASTTRGAMARRRTSASPPPASRTCSCSTARTRTTVRSCS